ncbi:LPS translocon maturation chaperone LptM [Zwartia vadi]|uniref:LPS translocon maturation chaperone LptM n=1 Tax=Zwartia vadi TaxID=3058168 RepID=UPI0025B5CCE0|nr:lipoprotein [Zwartia vadi]MDN3988175.1 lipoprotein [Zwartia vadi]
MIRKIHRRRFAGIVAMLTLSGWLAGCGFKGPLYMPPPKPTTAKPAPATVAIVLEPMRKTPNTHSTNMTASTLL